MSDTMLPLHGIHHVSALSAHIRRTHRFYPAVLGLRPIIKTVNQDEPTMYHLFYGDGAGSPGSDLTVFDVAHAAQEHRGNNSISRTTFRIHGDGAFAYWESRLAELGVDALDPGDRDGRRVLDFDDPEGIRLSLIEDRGGGSSHPWDRSPVPADYQVRGLGYVEITVPVLEPTDVFLVRGLGLQHDRTYPVAGSDRYSTHVYRVGPGGPDAEVHVVVRDDLPRARYGAGGVHHFALRTPSDQSMEAWVDRLETLDFHTSGVVDRHYFTSVYVREPNGVLFEIATDGPGFGVDGPPDAERLALPPFLAGRREEIEAQLEPLEPGADM